MIYLLSYSWYEDYRPSIVQGPKVPDWKAFCLSMLQEAVDLTVQRAKEENLSWLGWSEITVSMIKLLETRGYKFIQPEEHTFWGPEIIRNKSDFESNLDDCQDKIDFSGIYKQNRKIRRHLNYGMYSDRFTAKQENLIQKIALNHFNSWKIVQSGEVFCLDAWRISKAKHLITVALYQGDEVVKSFTAKTLKTLQSVLKKAWKGLKPDESQDIPFNIWDDYDEAEGGHTYGYVEEHDTIPKEEKEAIAQLIVNYIQKNLNTTELFVSNGGDTVVFDKLWHHRRELLVEELQQSGLTYKERKIRFYSES